MMRHIFLYLFFPITTVSNEERLRCVMRLIRMETVGHLLRGSVCIFLHYDAEYIKMTLGELETTNTKIVELPA